MCRLIFTLLLACVPLIAHAAVQGSTSPTLIIAGARVVPAPKGASAPVAITFYNPTSTTLWVEKVASPSAGRVVFQAYKNDNQLGLGVQVQELPRLQVDAGTRLTLTPNILEMRLIGLNQDLEAGLEIPLILKLSNGAAQTLRVPIVEESKHDDTTTD